MNGDVAINLAAEAIVLGFKLAMPFLGASLAVGLLVSVFQAATQIQEMTLTFIPKIVVTFVVLLLAGPWMLDQISLYAEELYTSIPQLAGPRQ
jgi:flagellar biosynthetic protein FliQ